MIGVLVCDFGGPQKAEELEPFLTLLLDDVLPFPRWIKRFAAPMIAKRRVPVVQPNYEMIGWSPLIRTHEAQVAALKEQLSDDLPVASCHMFTPPFAKTAVQDLLDQGVDRIIALPMFPHYSFATTHAAFSFAFAAMQQLGVADLPVHWIGAYYDHPLYLQALAATIREGVERTPGSGDTHLLFSPHGLPVSFLKKKKDPYPTQIRETARQVVRHMGWEGSWSVGWQSKLGRAAWLTPSTPQELQRLADRGQQRVTVVPVAFAAEHIETLHEIDIEFAEEAAKMGIPHFGRAPVLGTQPAFISCLATLVNEAITSFDAYHCVRCLLPKPEAHRRRERCPNCDFRFPDYLRLGVQ